MKYDEAYWNNLSMAIAREKDILEEKIKEVETWCNNNLPASRGLVYTKLEQDIYKERFFIWINQGIYTKHEILYFKDIGIEPLPKMKYVIR